MSSDDFSNDGPPARQTGSVTMRPAQNPALPPHPLDKRWFAHVDGQTYGPYSGHDVKRMAQSGQILESDFLCPEGGTSWVMAKNDPLLGPIFKRREETTQFHVPPPVNANGGTVVQVTNQIPSNNAALAAMLLTTGDAAPKSPGVALLLSFFICGAGQMYNGQVGKGIAMLIAYWLTALLMIPFFLIGIVLFVVIFILWIWSMADAYSTAKQMTLRYQQRVLSGLA